MLLTIVFLPLIEFFVFALFGTRVNRIQLSNFTIVSMGVLLLSLILMGPSIIAGNAYVTTLGS
jgi:NADH:ubiquinone oxidoreductase subunit 5 (subunit L)/multisubunit Na+/H+ antiporter MnhA subunit